MSEFICVLGMYFEVMRLKMFTLFSYLNNCLFIYYCISTIVIFIEYFIVEPKIDNRSMKPTIEGLRHGGRVCNINTPMLKLMKSEMKSLQVIHWCDAKSHLCLNDS